MPWATRTWPGLPQIWRLGSWLGLVQAVGFAIVVNLAVLGSFYWTELLPNGLLRLVWAAIGIFWVGSTVFSRQSNTHRELELESSNEEESFGEAVEHYLGGNWYEAQRVLGNLLRRNPRDIEAGLMWATVLRHAGRTREALEQLAQLERFDGHQKWVMEISHERELLERSRRKTSEEAAENSIDGATAEAA